MVLKFQVFFNNLDLSILKAFCLLVSCAYDSLA